MKKIKVVWLSPFPLDVLVPFGMKLTRPVGGHPCSWIVNWAKALAALPQVDLHLITYASRVKQSQSVRYSGYTVHVVRDAIPFTDRSWAALWDLDARTQFAHRKKKLLKKITELNPDVVHGHGTEDAYGLAAVESGYPAVVSIQGVIADYLRTNPTRRYKYAAQTEATTVRTGHYFMCRTHFDKGFVSSLNAEAHIFHMPEAMNPCFFSVDRSGAEPCRILHVGGFHERKGLEDLLVAVSELKSAFPDVTVDVVGGGSADRKAYLMSRAKELGVLENITVHGFLGADEIAELHEKATMFVITSQNENSPNTLAEALCAGTPCVAYDVGGISSMFIDGESGCLVPAGDTVRLAERVGQLFASPELRQQLGTKGMVDGVANRPDKVAKASLRAYFEMLKEPI
jgi:glycosyltransferase involved in cell wall biosynthesis